MLKLGTQTGSVTNHLFSRASFTMPEVGMGATLLKWSDRSPATISSVFEKGKYLYIGIQTDNYKRIDNNGMSENQKYEYTPNPKQPETFFRYDGDSWQEVRKNHITGRWIKVEYGDGILIGKREKYYDMSF